MHARNTRPAPGGPEAEPELRLARSAVYVCLALAVPVVGIAAVLAGAPGAIGAGLGVGLVMLLFGMSGATLAWAARISPEMLMGVALGGVLLRFMLYGLMLVLLGDVEAVHKPSLAIATAVALVITLIYEVRLVSRTPGFFWVRTGAVERSGT